MSEPKHIGKLLRDVLVEAGLWDDVLGMRLLREWSEIVGEAVAKHAKPCRLVDGELWLAVDEPTWREEIFNIRGLIAEQINEKLGRKVVKSIRII